MAKRKDKPEGSAFTDASKEVSLIAAEKQAILLASELSDLYYKDRAKTEDLQKKMNSLALAQKQSLLYAEELRTTYAKERAEAEELRMALRDIEETYKSTLLALVTALDVREEETNRHSHRVMEYTLELATKADIEGEELVDIGRGALLHDIGKIGVPDAILLKPGKLTNEEWVQMREHPRTGHTMLKNIKFLKGAASLVITHQECFDGTGYPDGLRGKDIPKGARLFAIADTMDAIMSDRPYRKARAYKAARDEIERCSSTQFDPDAVDIFLSVPEERWDEIREQVAAKNPR